MYFLSCQGKHKNRSYSIKVELHTNNYINRLLQKLCYLFRCPVFYLWTALSHFSTLLFSKRPCLVSRRQKQNRWSFSWFPRMNQYVSHAWFLEVAPFPRWAQSLSSVRDGCGCAQGLGVNCPPKLSLFVPCQSCSATKHTSQRHVFVNELGHCSYVCIFVYTAAVLGVNISGHPTILHSHQPVCRGFLCTAPSSH